MHTTLILLAYRQVSFTHVCRLERSIRGITKLYTFLPKALHSNISTYIICNSTHFIHSYEKLLGEQGVSSREHCLHVIDNNCLILLKPFLRPPKFMLASLSTPITHGPLEKIYL